MKEEYQVLFQRGYEEKEGRWLNGGNLYMSQRTFNTLEEAIKCRNLILEKENKDNSTIVVNGIGIEIENKNENDTKLKRIKINKRQVTEWEEV